MIREKHKPAAKPKNKKCDKCKAPAVITLGYGPHYFCENHFTTFFEKRFRKTIRRNRLLKKGEKIIVALSGGRDSTLLLFLLKKFYANTNKIDALMVDEGIKGYRDESIKTAKKNCERLGVKLTIVPFKKVFGITDDEIMPIVAKNSKLGGTCSFCGTLRRNVLNKYAKKMGADKVATAHNLDDEVQSTVMNIFSNDMKRFKRMGAVAGLVDHKGFVKRIKPFYETPENEIVAYCAFKEINYFGGECCPHSWTAKRNEYREMLNKFEENFPGTKYALLRFYEEVKPLFALKQKEKKFALNTLKECANCGEPTEKELCMACTQVKKIKELKKSVPKK
jgi:uncharacterized protein (TIGR00269 family)